MGRERGNGEGYFIYIHTHPHLHIHIKIFYMDMFKLGRAMKGWGRERRR